MFLWLEYIVNIGILRNESCDLLCLFLGLWDSPFKYIYFVCLYFLFVICVNILFI